jgi:hypothetical protein
LRALPKISLPRRTKFPARLGEFRAPKSQGICRKALGTQH